MISDPLFGSAVDHDPVPAGTLEGDGEPASGQVVADESRERRFAGNPVFAPERNGRSGRNAVGDADGIAGRERIAAHLYVFPAQTRGHRYAADVGLVPFLGSCLHPGLLFGQIDMKDPAAVAEHLH